MIKHMHVKVRRTPEETAKLRALRERYQRDKPAPAQLLAEGGHTEFVTLGELIFSHEIMASLKKERERQGISLGALAKRCKMDAAAISRLESGVHANPTLDTVYRIANALGKVIICNLEDAPTNGDRPPRRTKVRRRGG